MPRGLKNWYWVRDRKDDGPEWMRAYHAPTNLPRPIILVCGAWDILHAGHMRVLFTAKEKAGPKGTVVCAMYSDRLLKEAGKPPIQGWVERATALSYMPINLITEVDDYDEWAVLQARLEPNTIVVERSQLNQEALHLHRPLSRVKVAILRSASTTTDDLIRRCLTHIQPSTPAKGAPTHEREQ